ncbi:Lar family restriction alleviation protein [Mesorhizobium sp. M0139]|uniref:Lar family restriction alleviation protein n=1 Tax=Mesorhizobium sp. M0139 TaxID=2956892 RepID=UPI00333A41AA
MTSDTQLLPCPHCGGEALGHGHSYPPEQGDVQCYDCGGAMIAATEDEAIAAWNRRAPPKVGSGELDAAGLAQMVDKYATSMYGRIVGVPDFVIKQHFSEFAAEVAALAAPAGDQPAFWYIIAEPGPQWFICRDRVDAERTASNFRKYLRGCTGARIEPLFFASPVVAPVATVTLNMASASTEMQTLKPCEKHPDRYCNCEGYYPACRDAALSTTGEKS